MSTNTRVREWVKENAPMLVVLYENKYIGMAYDRFASLPPKEQKQVIFGVGGGIAGLFFLYILFSYISLWSTTSKTEQYYTMVSELAQHQRTMREKTSRLSVYEDDPGLAPGGIKAIVAEAARSAAISPRLLETSEDPGQSGATRQGTIRMQRVTLSQWVNFLKQLEGGPRPVSVKSLKATNDDKLRGYMQVDVVVTVPQIAPAPGLEGAADAG